MEFIFFSHFILFYPSVSHGYAQLFSLALLAEMDYTGVILIYGGMQMPKWFWQGLIIYILIMNLTGFVMMGMDKRRAKRGAWRIPEKTLLLTAVLGGSIGSICGMRKFRHKTKHWYFWYGLPAILAAQLVLGLWLAWQLFMR